MPPGFTRPSHIAAALASSAMLTLAGAPVALAHDAVVGGSPADGAVVTEFPRTLELTFSGEVQDGFNTFALSNTSTGEVVYAGEPHLDGRNVILDLPADVKGDPGEYRIGFQIISSDGHSTKGMTTFTYERADAASSSPAAPGAPETQETADTGAGDTGSNASGPGILPIALAGLGVIAVIAAAIAVAGRRRKHASPGTGDAPGNQHGER